MAELDAMIAEAMRNLPTWWNAETRRMKASEDSEAKQNGRTKWRGQLITKTNDE
jgi:hypothetical protein